VLTSKDVLVLFRCCDMSICAEYPLMYLLYFSPQRILCNQSICSCSCSSCPAMFVWWYIPSVFAIAPYNYLSRDGRVVVHTVCFRHCSLQLLVPRCSCGRQCSLCGRLWTLSLTVILFAISYLDVLLHNHVSTLTYEV
jgi:hypothetical protein